jgi:hypothetical protein
MNTELLNPISFTFSKLYLYFVNSKFMQGTILIRPKIIIFIISFILENKVAYGTVFSKLPIMFKIYSYNWLENEILTLKPSKIHKIWSLIPFYISLIKNINPTFTLIGLML